MYMYSSLEVPQQRVFTTSATARVEVPSEKFRQHLADILFPKFPFVSESLQTDRYLFHFLGSPQPTPGRSVQGHW